MTPPARKSATRSIVRIALIALVVIVVAGFIASRVSTGNYAITPGGAQPVAPLITIDGQQGTVDNGGKILLTDVLLTPITWFNWIRYRLDSSADIVPGDELVQPGVSTSQLDAQGYLEMSQSKEYAKVAALSRLGYHVGAMPDGVVVEAVGENAPAASALSVADLVLSIDGKTTNTACDVVRAVHDDPPGTSVVFRIEPATIHGDGSITNGAPVDRTVKLGTPPKNQATSDCPGATGPSKGFLGVSIAANTAYHFPFPISISTPNIGGPSAGLSMTLGIIDQLSHGMLLHHHTIAATGTIDPAGNVGEVGGVPQKAIAVSDAGASVFIVPVGEGSQARSTAGSSLRVEPVLTLNQALDELASLGGKITLADGTVTSPATPAPRS